MITKSKILLVEDDQNIAMTLQERLQEEGYIADWQETRTGGEAALKQSTYDLAILDVGLADGSGMEIAEFINTNKINTSIIFVSAMNDIDIRISGLELGAVDYVTKPFHLKELLLKIRNALNRHASDALSNSATTWVKIGDTEVNFNELCIRNPITDQKHDLKPKESEILSLLYFRRGQVVSREEIIRDIWPLNQNPSTRTVDNFILRIRKLIEPNPEVPTILESIRGAGYRLK